MSEDPLLVRTEVLRDRAGELTNLAYRLGHGLAGTPNLTVSASPDWAATGALTALESAAHGWLCAIGGRLARTTDGLRTAADEYDAADDRAARRLTGTG